MKMTRTHQKAIAKTASWKREMYKKTKTMFMWTALIVFSILFLHTPSHASSRIKDIASFEGVRDNMLVGYGLVVGLNGTGDDIKKSIFTRESLIGMLERLGVNARDTSLETDNAAAVVVTAVLPPFSRQGSRIDVNVAALGDASSLQGGTLLVTPLVGADGEVYAVGQGPLAIGGFQAGGNAETVTRGVPTNGKIANGAIIERELPFDMLEMESVKISLRNPDFTTARRVARVINEFTGEEISYPLDPSTIQMTIPKAYENNIISLITDIEQLRVEPDLIAKVVVDENSGVIVMGENVRISTVAIAQGNLTIRVTETPQVSQPNPFANVGVNANGTGNFVDAVTVDRTSVEVEEGDKKLTIVDSGVSLQDLVDGLNALGVTPRDMITILQAIKAAGALQAEIEVI